MKLVKENLFEFGKGNDPLVTMGLGRISEIKKFFRSFDVPDDVYTITKDNIIFESSLWLSNDRELISLPEGLIINNYLDLSGCINLTSLPIGLKVGSALDLNGCTSLSSLPEGLKIGTSLYIKGCTNLTKLPVNLNIFFGIYVYEDQLELISFIKNSKFKNQLEIE